jgi:cytochrome P450
MKKVMKKHLHLVKVYSIDLRKTYLSVLVIACHETTSNLMIWTLYNLANNPDVCHRLEAEVDSILNDDEEITTSTLSRLTYTEAVLKESLRLHQPVPLVVRKAIGDNMLTASDGKQIHVKKGTDIMVNFFMLHQYVR